MKPKFDQSFDRIVEFKLWKMCFISCWPIMKTFAWQTRFHRTLYFSISQVSLDSIDRTTLERNSDWSIVDHAYHQCIDSNEHLLTASISTLFPSSKVNENFISKIYSYLCYENLGRFLWGYRKFFHLYEALEVSYRTYIL
jgi:hypothetical protein